MRPLRHEQIDTPFLVEEPVNAEVLTLYLQQVPGPRPPQGDTIILANLATQKVEGVG